MIQVKEYVAERKNELHKIAHNAENKYWRKPCLVVIQVGDNPASTSYIKGKKKDAEEIGIDLVHKHYPAAICEVEVLHYIKELNEDFSVDGIIVQLPLPAGWNEKEIQLAIDPKKDVDGFHPMSKFNPCTPDGIVSYYKRATGHNSFGGLHVVILGRSNIVGKPLARMFTEVDATVTLCNSKTNLTLFERLCKDADLLVTAISPIEFFKSPDLFLTTRDIIDVGLGVGEDGKLHGNLHHDLVSILRERDEELGLTNDRILISGIGGVGLLTRLSLMENTMKAFLDHVE